MLLSSILRHFPTINKYNTINLVTDVNGEHYSDIITQFRQLAADVNVFVNGSGTALQPLS